LPKTAVSLSRTSRRRPSQPAEPAAMGSRATGAANLNRRDWGLAVVDRSRISRPGWHPDASRDKATERQPRQARSRGPDARLRGELCHLLVGRNAQVKPREDVQGNWSTG